MKKKLIGKLFPNLNQAVAYYSTTTFCITLNTISEKEFAEMVANKPDKKYAENMSVIWHEMQHHLDHISTLWGQNNIYKLFDAINGRLSLDVNQFAKIIPFKHEERQLHFNEYYTENYNTVEWKKADGNWIWQLSTGIRFKDTGEPDYDKPILFIKFATRQGQALNRVPLSIAALLETNSTKREVDMMFSYIASLDEDTKLVEKALYERHLFSEIIYNQDWAVYNAAVHLTSNILGLGDLIESLQISFRVSHLALNLPHSLISKIPIDTKKMSAWGDRPEKLMRNNNYGFIFYNLLLNYAPFFKVDGKFDLPRLLLSNNLPEEKELEDIVAKEMESIIAEYTKQPNFKNDFTARATEGLKLFRARGIAGANASIGDLQEKHGYKPTIIFSDTDFDLEFDTKRIFSSLPLDDLPIPHWYGVADILDFKMDEFYEVRGL